MQEANGSNDILDVIIARTNGHEFCEEDDVIHRGWENTDTKENGGLLAVLPKLVQT